MRFITKLKVYCALSSGNYGTARSQADPFNCRPDEAAEIEVASFASQSQTQNLNLTERREGQRTFDGVWRKFGSLNFKSYSAENICVLTTK